MTPQEIDRIYDMAANALQAEEQLANNSPELDKENGELIRRKAAIEHLENIKIYSFQDGYTDEAREALEMAIKALETHTPCDLCIYNPPSSMDGKPCSCCPAEPI